MNSPKVSIVSAYYNRENHVLESVQSLLEQTYENFEIIIVNDGSKDSTLEKLQTFNDPKIKIIDQKNQGFVNAIRNGIDAATGEYIAIHGSGDISYPERIEKQSQCLTENNHIGVVGCHVMDDNKTVSGTYILKTENGLNFTNRLLVDNMFTHGEVMFRKDIYQKVGGYRPFFTYAQDHDLWLRLSQHCDYRVIEEVLYRRFRLDTGVSQNNQKLMLQIYMSKFAIECMSKKITTGKDPLESIGPQCVFLREPTQRLAYSIAWIGIHEMLSGNHEEGHNIVKRARSEYLSLKTLGITILSGTHRNKILWHTLGSPILNVLYQRHIRSIGQT